MPLGELTLALSLRSGTQLTEHREPAEHVDNLTFAEAAFFQACLAHQLDARGKVKQPVMLPEATENGVWSGEGRLMVDGYSARVLKLLGLEQ
jgi:hypothetical protein